MLESGTGKLSRTGEPHGGTGCVHAFSTHATGRVATGPSMLPEPHAANSAHTVTHRGERILFVGEDHGSARRCRRAIVQIHREVYPPAEQVAPFGGSELELTFGRATAGFRKPLQHHARLVRRAAIETRRYRTTGGRSCKTDVVRERP